MKKFLSLLAVFLMAHGLEAMEQNGDELIRLNIGGYKFDTTRSTIQLNGGEYLNTLISGKFAVTSDRRQRIFIDRSIEEAKLVEVFLRSACLPKGFDKNLANAAADFFQIEAMKKYIKEEESFEISIKQLGGRIDSLKKMRHETTIAELKEKYQETTGCPVNMMVLLYENEILRDNHTLEYYNITKNTTLYFRVKLGLNN